MAKIARMKSKFLKNTTLIISFYYFKQMGLKNKFTDLNPNLKLTS
jgi:hypothetical protein|tara:strand:- start:13 stop:147 length:135 start_codon:yes stop_codon:yes gene_type:complete